MCMFPRWCKFPLDDSTFAWRHSDDVSRTALYSIWHIHALACKGIALRATKINILLLFKPSQEHINSGSSASNRSFLFIDPAASQGLSLREKCSASDRQFRCNRSLLRERSTIRTIISRYKTRFIWFSSRYSIEHGNGKIWVQQYIQTKDLLIIHWRIHRR